MQQRIVFESPILPGSISTAKSTCGKANCACKGSSPRLHGTYYRWTGFIAGKRTTKTLSRETAQECKRRIKNFKKLRQEIAGLLREAIEDAPWESVPKRKHKPKHRGKK